MKKRDLILISLFPALSLYAQEKPNVLLIMADDMGYECLGVNGSTYHTPVLDNMAESAVLFKLSFPAIKYAVESPINDREI